MPKISMIILGKILRIILITQFIRNINNEIDVYLTDIAGLEKSTDICLGLIQIMILDLW